MNDDPEDCGIDLTQREGVDDGFPGGLGPADGPIIEMRDDDDSWEA